VPTLGATRLRSLVLGQPAGRHGARAAPRPPATDRSECRLASYRDRMLRGRGAAYSFRVHAGSRGYRSFLPSSNPFVRPPSAPRPTPSSVSSSGRALAGRPFAGFLHSRSVQYCIVSNIAHYGQFCARQPRRAHRSGGPVRHVWSITWLRTIKPGFPAAPRQAGFLGVGSSSPAHELSLLRPAIASSPAAGCRR
jgi:hypothetical protein